jgi:Protein of unknown function (DUF2510)
MVERNEGKIGWNPDPTGRYPLRWFDGTGWTAQIFDGENMGNDSELLPRGLRLAGLPSLLLFLVPGLILLLMIALAIKGT